MTIKSKTEYTQSLTILKEAAYSYYNGLGIRMTDGEWDLLFAEIRKTEKDHPEWVDSKPVDEQIAAGVSMKGEVRHKRPMLSLENTYDKDDVSKFLNKFEDEELFIVEPKLDGVSASALYRDGVLVRIASRGIGNVGEDYSNASVNISGLPKTIPNVSGEVEIRGEIIMTSEDFEAANKIRDQHGAQALLNPRNGAAGSMRATGKPYSLPVSFYGYDIYPGHENLHEYLESLGVKANKHSLVSKTEVFDALNEVEKEMVTEVIPMDGAVIKVASSKLREKLGEGNRVPRWAVAYKFPIREVETTLLDVEWATGRTGAVTPRAIIKPTKMLGSTTRFVTLHNLDYIRTRDLMIGDTVLFYKAGYVIPRIAGRMDVPRAGTEQKIEPPTFCPSCGFELADLDSPVIRCKNPECDNSERKLEHAFSKKALDVDGFGPKLIEQLVDVLGVTRLDEVFDLSISDLEGLSRMGKKSANNLINALNERRNNCTFEQVFTALGIRMAGSTVSTEMGQVAGDIQGLLKLTEQDLISRVSKVAEKKAQIIVASIRQQKPTIEGLVARGINPKGTPVSEKIEGTLTGNKFVLTGSATEPYLGKSRDEVGDIIVANGGEVSKTLSKKVDYLVAGEKAGTKVGKAESLGVKVISFKELSDLLT